MCVSNTRQTGPTTMFRKGFETVTGNGDTIMYKKDGLRSSQVYTVVITNTGGKFESIRCDRDTLSESIEDALKEYKKIRKRQV